MSKRTIIQKTDSQIEILEKFYQSGMTSYGIDNHEARELLAEAVEETNLPEKTVKVFYDIVCQFLLSSLKLLV